MPPSPDEEGSVISSTIFVQRNGDSANNANNLLNTELVWFNEMKSTLLLTTRRCRCLSSKL